MGGIRALARTPGAAALCVCARLLLSPSGSTDTLTCRGCHPTPPLQVDEHAGGASSDAEAQSPASAGLAAGGDGGQFEGTPYAHGAAQLCSLERRVASMGGIPALGACVLPRMTPGMRPQLTVTASPAAVEIMRGRLGGSDADATPLRKTGGSGGEAEAAATPLVQLRATPAGRPADTPGGAAPADSELAAAIQRRMQRLGSSSPEKDAAAASPPGTVAG
jgi:hypothetical protein